MREPPRAAGHRLDRRRLPKDSQHPAARQGQRSGTSSSRGNGSCVLRPMKIRFLTGILTVEGTHARRQLNSAPRGIAADLIAEGTAGFPGVGKGGNAPLTRTPPRHFIPLVRSGGSNLVSRHLAQLAIQSADHSRSVSLAGQRAPQPVASVCRVAPQLGHLETCPKLLNLLEANRPLFPNAP